MTDAEALLACEERIFAAIKARDLPALGRELTDDFVHASPGQPDQDRQSFLAAISALPFRIVDIKGDGLGVRVVGETALLWGIQRARVALADGTEVDAATAFVDVFARIGGDWRLRHAVSVELR